MVSRLQQRHARLIVARAKANNERRRRRYAAGRLARLNTSMASRVTGLSRQVCIYWRKKLEDTTFHSSTTHGGNRTMTYAEGERMAIKSLIWTHTKLFPSSTIQSRVRFVWAYNFKISSFFVKRLYSQWRWTCKKPERKHLLKYTAANMTYYSTYIREVFFVPWDKIHFLDEASFVSRNLHTQKAIAPAGEKIFVYHGEPLSETYSATILTNLRDPNNSVISNLVTDSNSQYDFAGFIIYVLNNNLMREDDILVLDNASIHAAADTYTMIYDLCAAKRVHIKFLPTYSPELNR